MAKSILIVDDDPDNLLILGIKLKEKGYIVFSAISSVEAIKTAKTHRPDVIILDILMPGMDGTELAQEFKREPDTRDVPIFFVTGLQTKEEELQPGFVVGRRMFAKPVDIERLHQEIIKLVGA